MKDMEVNPAATGPTSQAQVKLPWESIDFDEPHTAEGRAFAGDSDLVLASIDTSPTDTEPQPSDSAAGPGAAELHHPATSIAEPRPIFLSLPPHIPAAAPWREDRSEEALSSRAFFPDEEVAAPLEIQAAESAPALSSAGVPDLAHAPSAVESADRDAEMLEDQLPVDEAELRALAQASGELGISEELELSTAAQEAVLAFSMTDSLSTAVSEMATAAESVQRDESRPADREPVFIPLPDSLKSQIHITAPPAAVSLPAEPEMELVLDAPAPITTGGGWTIPLLCMGIGLIACCMVIPQAELNRALFHERQSLQANLESVHKQVAVNEQFLKKVMDDPGLAERLASRQMKMIRKGQKALAINQVSDNGDMSPFALTAGPAPVAVEEYHPVRGTIADLCNSPRARLYLLGSAMTMVAAGLVLGCGTPRTS